MKLLPAIGLLLIFTALTVLYVTQMPKETEPYFNEIHIHADFAIYLDGKRVDVSEGTYQSDKTVARHAFLHLHNHDGDVLHVHAKQQTFAAFLESLGILLDKDCLTVQKVTRCRKNGLQMFVNGKPHLKPFTMYQPKDLDQILLTNTSDQQKIEQEKNKVTDKSCIQSGSCPERGDPIEGCLTDGNCAAPPSIEPLPLLR